MVVKKDQINMKKKTMRSFETLFFVGLGSLSLLFLLITCWFLFTGDEHLFFQGFHISPRHLFILLYIQSFFLGEAMLNEEEHKSDVGHFLWAL
jgi:hypothetical protein